MSHDEVVHGKQSLLARMPGDDWQKFANLRMLFGYQWTQPGKKLLFMGGELAQWHEWGHEGVLDWGLHDAPGHEGVRAWVRECNRLYREEAALHSGDAHPAGFAWVEAEDAEHSVYAYLRLAVRDGAPDPDVRPVLVVVNATPTPIEQYRLGVPEASTWREIASSDDLRFGGSGVTNDGPLEAHPVDSHGTVPEHPRQGPAVGGGAVRSRPRAQLMALGATPHDDGTEFVVWAPRCSTVVGGPGWRW